MFQLKKVQLVLAGVDSLTGGVDSLTGGVDSLSQVALLKGDLSPGFFKVNEKGPAYVLHMPKANYGSAGGTGRVAVDFAMSVGIPIK
eukprot:1189736-Prorocentrum_minimum.AAC.3